MERRTSFDSLREDVLVSVSRDETAEDHLFEPMLTMAELGGPMKVMPAACSLSANSARSATGRQPAFSCGEELRT